MFKGSFTALITPFKNGKVDEKRLDELVEWHLKSGTHGIVPCGTTGESACNVLGMGQTWSIGVGKNGD